MAPILSLDVHPSPTDTPQFPASKPKPGQAKPTTVEAATAADGSTGRVDYMARAQWLRAAVLGANDGMVSVASLMIGVGAVHADARAMLVSGLAGLVGGACSMAIGEFVSVYAQCDIQLTAHAERSRVEEDASEEEEAEGLPSPAKAAAASALAFAAGALLPLLSGGFVRPYAARVAAVCAASSLGLAGFGAYLGGGATNVVRSGARVLLGGWLAMAVTYGVLKLFSLAFKTTGVSSA